MWSKAKPLLTILLTVLLLEGYMVFAAGASADGSGQALKVEKPSGRTAGSAENPVDKASWTAWYKDSRANMAPEFHASTVAPDGTTVAVGSVTDDVASPIKGDLIVARYDQAGQPIAGWPRLYSDGNFPGTFKHWSEGQEVLVDSSGNITVAGYSIENNIWYASIWRFDSSGNLLTGWPQYTAGVGIPTPRAWVMGLIIDANGDIVCCGASGNNMRENIMLVKYRQNGTVVGGWPKYYPYAMGQNLAYDIIQDSDGNYVVAGYTSGDPPPSDNRNALLYKIDTSGVPLPGWPKTWDSGGGLIDMYYSVSQDTNGDYCLVGICQGVSYPAPSPQGTGKLVVTRYDKDGNQRTAGWPQIYAKDCLFDYSPPDSWRGSVDPSGNIVAAATCDFGAGINTVKYLRDGSMYYGFPRSFNRAGYDDVTRSCSVDEQGNIYTVGYSRLTANPLSDYSTFVIKYPPEYAWYLAEGSTGANEFGSFETWILVQNPGDETANVQLYYQTPTGEVPGHKITLNPHTRETRNVSEFVPNQFSVSTKVVSDRAIIAERAMYWSSNQGVFRQAAHDSIGVTTPSANWYLAEGSTGISERGSFETWVLVQNPGDETANVQLYYQTPTGEVPGHKITLNPHSRETRNVSEFVPNEFSVSTRVVSDKPIIAERAVYWSSPGVYREAAHDSIGVTTPAANWYLAEGSTGTSDFGSFETWILVQNPGDERAEAQLYYQTPTGEVTGHKITLNPHSRETRNVSDFVPNRFSVSTRVVSDRPVIAERAMYWSSREGVYRQAATDSIGVTAPGKNWFLAEGSTGINEYGSFESWILVQNPGDETASVQLYYQTPSGEVTGHTITLNPRTRETRNVSDFVPNQFSVSTKVVSDKPVIAERAMYWNASLGAYRQAAHDSIGYDP